MRDDAFHLTDPNGYRVHRIHQLSVSVDPLVAADFRVVAWDAPPHGESASGRYGRHYSSIGVRAS